jgi:hypothetical protein
LWEFPIRPPTPILAANANEYAIDPVTLCIMFHTPHKTRLRALKRQCKETHGKSPRVGPRRTAECAVGWAIGHRMFGPVEKDFAAI